MALLQLFSLESQGLPTYRFQLVEVSFELGNVKKCAFIVGHFFETTSLNLQNLFAVKKLTENVFFSDKTIGGFGGINTFWMENRIKHCFVCQVSSARSYNLPVYNQQRICTQVIG